MINSVGKRAFNIILANETKVLQSGSRHVCHFFEIPKNFRISSEFNINPESR